jgi:hypothetical protein
MLGLPRRLNLDGWGTIRFGCRADYGLEFVLRELNQGARVAHPNDSGTDGLFPEIAVLHASIEGLRLLRVNFLTDPSEYLFQHLISVKYDLMLQRLIAFVFLPILPAFLLFNLEFHRKIIVFMF